MAINETLKFSWGHIIAFVALIFISYVSFMGITYLTDGNFIFAGIGVVVVDLILILFFIVPQILKATDAKFDRRIIFERILICTAPIFFVVVMVPYAHFWTVFKNREVIEKTFSESLETTKGMFDSYEEYAEARVRAYSDSLTVRYYDTVAMRNPQEMRCLNQVEALSLQLKSDNFDNLKATAVEWVDDAAGTTVWNVFKIGNLKTIEKSLDDWNSSLTEFSKKKMTDESANVKAFTSEDKSVMAAKEKFNTLRSIYTSVKAPTIIAIGVAVLLYAMLMFPYFIQNRNTKSIYSLFGNERTKKSAKSAKPKKEGNEILFVEDGSSSNKGDYDSFTL